jgi:hypothetical protein
MFLKSTFPLQRGGLNTFTNTGTVNNFDVGNAGLIRLNNATDLTITGIKSGQNGQTLTLVAVGAGNVYLANQNGGSSSANQFLNIVTSGSTPLVPGGWASYRYDGPSGCWRLMGHEQGGFLTPTFAAGDYTANGAMTWTVAAGDVTGAGYYIRGRQLFFTYQLDTTSVTAPLNTDLRITIPAGFQCNRAEQGYVFIIDNGTFTSGRYFTGGTGSTTLTIQKGNAANWLAAVNTTYMALSGAIEVI